MLSLGALLYDKIMKPTEQACLIEWRADLLKGVDGKVLEIGAGTGASLALYPNNSSLELYLAEPDHNMRSQLAEKVNASNLSNVAILACPSEAIESEDNFYDHVFVSLVCCSVNDVEASLQEIKRVMKPGGRFIFLEHVAAEEGTKRRKWQGRVNFLWRKLAGNCHLNRETEKHIKQAGFIITEIKRESMRKSMPLVRPTIRGIARLS